jgi:hypothetical protein
MKRSRPSSTDGDRLVKHVVRQFLKSSAVEIDGNLLGRVRAFGQQGESQIRELFAAIWKELQGGRSKARLAAVLLVDDLLLRSVLFRKLVCGRLRDYSEWAIGIASSAFPLPEDEERGMLRTSAIGFLRAWHEQFVPLQVEHIPLTTTDHIRQLHMEFVFLRDKVKIPFVDVEREQERRREEEQAERRRVAVLDQSRRELAELCPLVMSNLSELENAIGILFPSFEERFEDDVVAENQIEKAEEDNDAVEWEDEDEAAAGMESLPQIGGFNDDFEIDIAISTKPADDPKAPVQQAAMDAAKILARTHIPKLKRLFQVLPENASLKALLNQAEAVLERANKLSVR